MPTQGSKKDSRHNLERTGDCPICGQEPADMDTMYERRNGKETEEIPGRWYDHDGDGLCIEWADGKIVQN